MDQPTYYPAIILWLFPDLKKGGCIAATDGETYLFQMFDERNRGALRNRVFDESLDLKPGDLVQFAIEFNNDGSFGRTDHRITSLVSLSEIDCSAEEVKTLRNICDDYTWERQVKRGFTGGPRMRSRSYGD